MSNHLQKEDGGVSGKVKGTSSPARETKELKSVDRFEVSDNENTKELLGSVKFYCFKKQLPLLGLREEGRWVV